MKRKTIFHFVLLLVSPVLGIGSREFDMLPAFITSHAGDFFWATASFALLSLIFRKTGLLPRILAAFLFSVLVETLQLAHWPVLEAIRSTLAGRLLIGTGFLWIDFLRYAAGILFAAIWEIIFFRRRPETA